MLLQDTKEQKQNNLAFKYLVDISVARTRLSTKLIYLSFFKNWYLMTMYKSLVEQSGCIGPAYDGVGDCSENCDWKYKN